MDKIDKILKMILLIALIVVVAGLSFFGFGYYKCHHQIDLFLNGERIEKKEYFNYKHKVTLLLHTVGAYHYKTFIYILEGTYNRNVIPVKGNYIRFPNGAGIFLEWSNDSELKIISDSEPVINTLSPLNFRVNLIINRKKLKQLIKSGKPFTRYKIDSTIKSDN
jgi:hypothetical protein